MLRLSKEYPGDLGILMPLMLNLLQLKPGNAFFMTVDEPHAYLRGDILEVLCLTHACADLFARFVLCTSRCLLLLGVLGRRCLVANPQAGNKCLKYFMTV